MNNYVTEARQRVDRYRQKAEEARMAAARAITPAMSEAFSAIAQTWDQMADAELASTRESGRPQSDQRGARSSR